MKKVIVVSKFYCGFYHIYSQKKKNSQKKFQRSFIIFTQKMFWQKISKFSSDVEKLKIKNL
jgi:hypothetical protein